MRYTETISIPWHTFAGEKPCPNRDIVVKHYGATTLFAPIDLIHAEDVPRALTKYDRYDEWAYADEIKTLQTDGRILPDVDDLITQDNVAYFAIVSVSCYLYDYDNPYENVTAELVLKDGTVIPFDVPYFKDKKEICHPHRFIYNGNAYVIDILPNSPSVSQDFHRAVIRRCWGVEHPIQLNGYIATF